MSVYREYDIRGTYPEQVNYKFAYDLGRRLVKRFGTVPLFIVGYDCRASSEELRMGLMEGITTQGGDVYNLGMCTTCQLYLASSNMKKKDECIAIMVTASHNPPNYGGFKICKNNAEALTGADIANLKDIELEDFGNVTPKKGEVRESNVPGFAFETELLQTRFEIKPRVKVVIDYGNGVGALQAMHFSKFTNLIEFVEINKTPDGNFPNHNPDPLTEVNLTQLKYTMADHNADWGIAYDGDADRVVFVDRTGNTLTGDFIFPVLLWYMHKNGRLAGGETILVDFRCSKFVEEWLAGDFEVHRYRVGHSYIKREMKRLNCAVGGEYSGHYYFRDFSFAESSIYMTFIMLEALLDPTFSKIYRDARDVYEQYHHSGELNYEVDNPAEVMGRFTADFGSQNVKDCVETKKWFKCEIDDDSWVLVRPSGTENRLRLIVETKTAQGTRDLIKICEELINGNAPKTRNS